MFSSDFENHPESLVTLKAVVSHASPSYSGGAACETIENGEYRPGDEALQYFIRVPVRVHSLLTSSLREEKEPGTHCVRMHFFSVNMTLDLNC